MSIFRKYKFQSSHYITIALAQLESYNFELVHKFMYYLIFINCLSQDKFYNRA
jgi:hypothetical protein